MVKANGERRTFDFSCERCGRLLARAIAESSTMLIDGESQIYGRLICEECQPVAQDHAECQAALNTARRLTAEAIDDGGAQLAAQDEVTRAAKIVADDKFYNADHLEVLRRAVVHLDAADARP